jgi:hypothetical protein
MKKNKLFLKIQYILLKKSIFNSLESIYDARPNIKDSLGIYILDQLTPKKLIKSFTSGVSKGFYIFFYPSNKNISYRKLTLINELTNIYGVHLILFLKDVALSIYNNNITVINTEKKLANRIFTINSYKISFVLPQELTNPAVVMTLKIQGIDVVFSKSTSYYEVQDFSNNILAYILTDKNIFIPSIIDKNKAFLKDKNLIWLNLKYLKTLKNNYLENNYTDLQRIKIKLDLI